MRRGFTLIELLNVMAIIAILMAIFMPAVRAAKNAAVTFNATLSMRQLTDAVSLYMADSDDTFPIAMYREGSEIKAWFGKGVEGGEFDPKSGILAPYTSGRAARDMAHQAPNYFGDHSGFGYNWGYLGSDTNITLDYSGYPNLKNPARGSELEDPSQTAAFATSIFFFAPWMKGGDGVRYDFGFIDPPQFWRGNPNVDFRHGDPPVVDEASQKVTPKGLAIVAFAGGSVKTIAPGKLTDAMFARSRQNGG